MTLCQTTAEYYTVSKVRAVAYCFVLTTAAPSAFFVFSAQLAPQLSSLQLEARRALFCQRPISVLTSSSGPSTGHFGRLNVSWGHCTRSWRSHCLVKMFGSWEIFDRKEKHPARHRAVCYGHGLRLRASPVSFPSRKSALAHLVGHQALHGLVVI